MDFLLRGLIVGLSIAATVGPMSILTVRRTLTEGRLAGLVTGLGVATADGAYGAVAGFGLTVIADLLIAGRVWLRLAGGLFLCYLGVKSWLAAPATREAEASGPSLPRAYASALALTLTNPMTILSFGAIFAGLGAGVTGKGYGSAALVVAGVFLGSALWWVVLTTVVSTARSKITPRVLRWVNRASGLTIAGFGVLALASLLRN